MKTVLDQITHSIQFQINKHGQHCGMTSVEEVVNSLTQYELLVMICEWLDDEYK